MIKISEDAAEFLQGFEDITISHIARVTKSTGFIQPGDVMMFNYPTSAGTRLVFVVSTKRAAQGQFISTKNNILLTCFKLNAVSVEVAQIVLQRLYKNRQAASYDKVIRGLSAIFGRDNFRTYNIHKIQGLQEVYINE